MKTDFDVIVVGAGVNGITGGAYLQKAGLEVAVVEGRNEIAPFAPTEDIFGVGVGVDTHAVICFADQGPVYKDLELDRFGFEVINPDPMAGATWKDGKNVLFYVDPRKTAGAMERHSPRDAQTYLRIVGKMFPDIKDIVELLSCSPPSEEKLDLLWELGKYADLSPDDFRTMNGFELLDLLFESEYVKMAVMAIANIGALGDPTEKGEGAVMTLPSLYFPFGLARGGMHNLPHALVRCFRHHGGTLLLNAPVERVIYERGVAKGVVLSEDAPYPEKELKARQAVILNVTPVVALPIIGEETVRAKDPALWRKMKEWDLTGHCAFTSFFLLRKATPWKSASWNPDIMKCPFPYRAWDSWDHAKRCGQYFKNEDFWEIVGHTGETFSPAVGDRERFSPEGYSVHSFEVEYPINLRRYGGIRRWDDREFTDEIHRRHLEIMEQLAPGFKELVIDSKYFTPMDNWRKNPSAKYGHEMGGDVSGSQWYLGRMPHRSPIPHLYFSQSTWPSGYTNLSSGYVAAGVVAEDLGVQNQPWWTNRPLEYWMGKLGLG